MRFVVWFGRSDRGADKAVAGWRREWGRAAAAPEAASLERLRGALRTLSASAAHAGNGSVGVDFELEEEMLDGLARLLALTGELGRGQVPRIETYHRVVGAEPCHFAVPASMPDEASQPAGRLLLTSARAVFVGGPRVTVVAWHAARSTACADRDVVIVRGDGLGLYRFRCNTYGDALCAAAIARHLVSARHRRL